MGIHTSKKRFAHWLVSSIAALLCSGCFLLPNETPTPQPTIPPTQTPIPTPQPTPSPTPLPPPTPTRTPEPGCAVDWAWKSDRLEVTEVDITRMDGLMAGDRILTIEGRLAIEVILEAEEDFSGVQDPAQRRSLALESILTSNHVLLLGVQHMEEPFYYFNLHPDCH